MPFKYDALVLYRYDEPIGVYDTWEEIEKITGFSPTGARHLAQAWYHERWDKCRDEGKAFRSGYLVQPVKL